MIPETNGVSSCVPTVSAQNFRWDESNCHSQLAYTYRDSSNLQFESNLQFGALEEASMTVDDVVGTAARDRYKLNNLRVSIEDAKALEFLKKTSNWLPLFFNGGL